MGPVSNKSSQTKEDLLFPRQRKVYSNNCWGDKVTRLESVFAKCKPVKFVIEMIVAGVRREICLSD